METWTCQTEEDNQRGGNIYSNTTSIYIYTTTNIPIKHTKSKSITKAHHKPKKVSIHTNTYIHRIKPNLTQKTPQTKHIRQKPQIVYIYSKNQKPHINTKSIHNPKTASTKNNYYNNKQQTLTKTNYLHQPPTNPPNPLTYTKNPKTISK